MSKGEKNGSVDMFDPWLSDDGPAALVLREFLVPVEGKGAVVFPPTYPKPEDGGPDNWSGYNIDRFEDGKSVCQIDSVGSQANRMEPIFLRENYKKLVPQVVITAGSKKVNLLEAGHRAADAIVRFSDLNSDLSEAFKSYAEGDAIPLAKLAPTSIVFGAWDSRDTYVKVPRIVRSVIRAYNVKPLHRSAQYIAIAEEILKDGEDEKATKRTAAELGLTHVPAVWTHGGVQVQGDIRREAILNLVTIRALKAKNEEDMWKLRRYILGLALVAFTARQSPALREGCELVLDENRPPVLKLVYADGHRQKLELSPPDAAGFARAAADDFGVGEDREAKFNSENAKSKQAKSKQERKADRKKRGQESSDEDDQQESSDEAAQPE